MTYVSCEMDAVLHIFTYDDELAAKALPHVNIERQSIDWYAIFKNHFGSGHYAAVVWAYCLWMDRSLEQLDPFGAAFSMDAGLRRRVIQALAIRWCLPIDNLKTLRIV